MNFEISLFGTFLLPTAKERKSGEKENPGFDPGQYRQKFPSKDAF
jgi:hypothetical protein